MQFPVLVEQTNGNGYRASSSVPFEVSAQGATREEALRNLQNEVETRIKGGAEIVFVDLPVENPWLKMAGIFNKDDPAIQEWKKAMAEYRDQIEKDESYP